MGKNMKKHTARNRAVTTLLSVLSAALVLAGCFNPLDPIEPAAQTGAGSLSVSIAGQGGGARTLYPNPAFTKYVLTFASEGESYGPQTLTGTSTAAFNDIPAGTWTITAVGYVTINEQEYAAAEGVSDPVDIVAGQSQSVSIEISAEQDGDPGFFYYSVTFPEGKVDTATLTLSRFDTSWSDYIADPIDLKISSSGYVDGGESGSGLTPGYYRVDITLENGYQRAGISEVVHIYSNMETRAEYAYTEADFVDLVTLSGTITVDGTSLSDVWLDAHERRTDGSSVYLGHGQVINGSWVMKIPTVSENTEIYFTLSYPNGEVGNIPGITLNPGDTAKSGIALNLITLSGTITVDGASLSDLSDVWLNANERRTDGSGVYLGHIQVSDGSWSMKIPAASEENTEIYFTLSYPNGEVGNIPGITLNPGDTAKSGIALNLITLSGTVTATVNGEAPSWVDIGAPLEGDWRWIASTSINPYSPGASWSIIVPAFDVATTLTFSVNCFNASGDYIGSASNISPIPVHNSAVPGIALGDVSLITLSGSIGIVTANGVTYSREINIEACNQNGDSLGGNWRNNESGAWYIAIPTTNLESTTSISFRVGIDPDGPDGSYLSKDIPGTHSYTGQYISNISLGDVNFTYITLRGTLNATADGENPSRVFMYAHTEDGSWIGARSINSYSPGASWSIIVPAFSEETTVIFGVELYDSSGNQIGSMYDVDSTPVHDRDVSNITLNVDSITQATITITFSGFTDEEIDLSHEGNQTLSKSNGDNLTVSLSDVENYSSITWYEDGQESYSGQEYNVHASWFSLGPHTISAVVVKEGVPYSKTFNFQVTN